MASPKKKVLIVDDDLVLSYLYESYLEKLGFAVEGHMVYGKTAVETVKKQNPDLILMDIMLEGEMDGIEAVANIQEEVKDIPVIYITSSTDGKHKQRAQKTNYLDFLVKPIEFDQLKQSLANHFTLKT